MGLRRADQMRQRAASAPQTVGLDSPDPTVRWESARGAPDTAEANAALAGRLASESNPVVRDALLTTLASHQAGEIAGLLLPLLASEDASLRNEVARTLTTMPGGVAAEVPRLLADHDSDVRIMAVTVISHLQHEQVPDWLAGVARTDQHPNVVGAALAELVDVAGPEQVPVFADAKRRFPEDPFIAYVCRQAERRAR